MSSIIFAPVWSRLGHNVTSECHSTGVSLWAGLVLRLVCEVLVSVSCVSRLPPVSLNRYSPVKISSKEAHTQEHV